jgi:hypothetical protein
MVWVARSRRRSERMGLAFAGGEEYFRERVVVVNAQAPTR